MEPTLTIGMAHHNDWNGAYFTIQDIRKELIFSGRIDLLKRLHFVVIENDPSSDHAKALKQLKNSIRNLEIVDFDSSVGTSSTRNKIIDEAITDFVMVMDCHVLLCPTVDVLDRLFTFISYNPKTSDLFSGPLVYDNMGHFATHYNDDWGGQMWGRWGHTYECQCEAFNFSIIEDKDNQQCKFISMVEQKEIDKCGYCDNKFPENLPFAGHEHKLHELGYLRKGINKQEKPFEIFAQGLGCFLTRKNSWLRFNEHTRGFGGEECYIHEKYRQAGHKTLCLPFLKWLHRFGRPDGVKYPLTVENKLRNYILEFTELGLDLSPLKKHFVEENDCSLELWDKFIKEANTIYNKEEQTENIADSLQKQIEELQSKLNKIKS